MKLFSRDNEQTIVRKLNRGDATAIDLLYAEYAPLLTAVCARYVAQNEDIKDILQEAFIKMFDKGRTFNYRGKGSLKAQLNIKADTSASQLYKAKVMLARMIKSYQKQDRMTE